MGGAGNGAGSGLAEDGGEEAGEEEQGAAAAPPGTRLGHGSDAAPAASAPRGGHGARLRSRRAPLAPPRRGAVRGREGRARGRWGAAPSPPLRRGTSPPQAPSRAPSPGRSGDAGSESPGLPGGDASREGAGARQAGGWRVPLREPRAPPGRRGAPGGLGLSRDRCER